MNALLDAEADRLCNARRYERSEARRDTRAAHYERRLQTKAGAVRLKVPKLRQRTFETAIIERYRRPSAERYTSERASGWKGLWSVAEEGPSTPRCVWGQGSAFGGWGLFAATLLEAVAVAVHLQDVDVVGKPIEQGAGQPFRAEDFGPFLEGQIAGHQR